MKPINICAVCAKKFEKSSDHSWWCGGSEGKTQEELTSSDTSVRKGLAGKKAGRRVKKPAGKKAGRRVKKPGAREVTKEEAIQRLIEGDVRLWGEVAQRGRLEESYNLLPKEILLYMLGCRLVNSDNPDEAAEGQRLMEGIFETNAC